MNNPKFSIIIPQRNSLDTIPRLLNSIPNTSSIEIILVDNSPTPIEKTEINIDRDYTLLWSPPEHYAGGARNVGVKMATGKWLIFADADDYFEEGAFKVFDEYYDSESDVIYFSSKGIYSDGSGLSNRGDQYNKLINGFLNDSQKEMELRVDFSVPWAKMIRREMIETNNIRFDEVVAANDAYFSLLAGYYAKKISASEDVVYIVTTNKGSLTKRKDEKAIWSRYVVALRKNRFLKEKKIGKYQSSVMIYLMESWRFGIRTVLKFLIKALAYRQNIFIGCSRWLNSYKRKRSMDQLESKYYSN